MFHRHQQGRKVPPANNQMKETPLPETTETINQPVDQNEINPGFSATEEAPKKRGRKPGAQVSRETETLKKIRTTLEMMFGTVSTLAIASGGVDSNGIPKPLARDGLVIQQSAPNLIDALLVLCQQDKNVREFFLSLSTGSAYANVVIASIPLVIGIMANHNLIPPIFGSAPVQNGTSPLGVSGN